MTKDNLPTAAPQVLLPVAGGVEFTMWVAHSQRCCGPHAHLHKCSAVQCATTTPIHIRTYSLRLAAPCSVSGVSPENSCCVVFLSNYNKSRMTAPSVLKRAVCGVRWAKGCAPVKGNLPEGPGSKQETNTARSQPIHT